MNKWTRSAGQPLSGYTVEYCTEYGGNSPIRLGLFHVLKQQTAGRWWMAMVATREGGDGGDATISFPGHEGSTEAKTVLRSSLERI